MGKGGDGGRISAMSTCSCALPTRGASIRLLLCGLMEGRFRLLKCSIREFRARLRVVVSTARYRVRIGSHVTNLFLERHVFDATLGKPPVVRWWVEAYG